MRMLGLSLFVATLMLPRPGLADGRHVVEAPGAEPREPGEGKGEHPPSQVELNPFKSPQWRQIQDQTNPDRPAPGVELSPFNTPAWQRIEQQTGARPSPGGKSSGPDHRFLQDYFKEWKEAPQKPGIVHVPYEWDQLRQKYSEVIEQMKAKGDQLVDKFREEQDREYHRLLRKYGVKESEKHFDEATKTTLQNRPLFKDLDVMFNGGLSRQLASVSEADRQTFIAKINALREAPFGSFYGGSEQKASYQKYAAMLGEVYSLTTKYGIPPLILEHSHILGKGFADEGRSDLWREIVDRKGEEMNPKN